MSYIFNACAASFCHAQTLYMELHKQSELGIIGRRRMVYVKTQQN